MAYSFQKTGDGNVQVSQNGKIISTGTADFASTNYGYVDPTANAPKPATEVGVVSSAQGANTIAQKSKQLSNLTPVPVTTTGTDTKANDGTAVDTGKTTTPTATKITLMNPDTGQTSVFEDADLNKSNIQGLMGSGYKVTETSGNLPSWLVAGTTGTTNSAQSKAQTELDNASADLKSLTDNLSKFTVSDADLKGQTDAITSQWNARIADMQKINQAREGNITTTGYRLGMQFAGGKGGVFGGIISEEERQGVARISELEGQKQSAISAAKSAAQQQNWQVFSKNVDIAQKAYEDKVTALKELNANTVAQNKIIADSLQKITDENNKRQDEVTKTKSDILISLGKNSASVPPEVIQAVNDATDVASAVTAAGQYLQTVPTGGIVGEYMFYKQEAMKNGQTPVDFNTYQNIDANRKAKATASASGSDTTSNLSSMLVDGLLAPSELSKRTTGSASYNDVLVAADKYSMAKYGKHFNIAQADRDYKFAQRPQTQDTLNYLGSLVGAIDPETGQPTGGNLKDLLDKSNAITRTDFPALNSAKFYALMQTGDPQVVAYLTTVTEVSDQIAKILQGGGSGSGTSDAKLRQASALFNTGFSKSQVEATVKAIMPLLANRAKSMVSDNPYLSDYADQFGFSGKPTTAQTIVQKEAQADSTVTAGLANVKATNPILYQAASKMYLSTDPATGQPYTASDILIAFPELNKK